MAFDIKLPNINSGNDSEKLRETIDYLYQMIQELNWALNTLESEIDKKKSDD